MKLYAAILLCVLQSAASAGEVRIAAASNFSTALRAIVERFEADTGHRVSMSFGSTGKHYAQIRNGAPFDVFFAADRQRPTLLEAEGIALSGSRFNYALGRLVLWSPESSFVDAEGDVLDGGDFRHLAIANPLLAPYGRAAQQVLQARGLWEDLQARLVRGENIAQAYQFVRSGNARLGFVAYAQVMQPGGTVEGSFWLVPESLHAPIEQQAVLLRDTPAARDLLDFVRSEVSLAIIRDYGYNIP